MRVYGGSFGGRGREGEGEREKREREAEKEEVEEIIWLVPAEVMATLIPCPAIFYACWLDRGLVGIWALGSHCRCCRWRLRRTPKCGYSKYTREASVCLGGNSNTI